MSHLPMTVAAAIEKLRAMPPDAELMFVDHDGEESAVTELELVVEEGEQVVAMGMSLMMADDGYREKLWPLPMLPGSKVMLRRPLLIQADVGDRQLSGMSANADNAGEGP